MVPGWRNSGPDHWQSRWERHLPRCVRVQQEDWEQPESDRWVSCLGETVSACSRPVVLVAHSLGCHTVARWAATDGGNIRAALLVAPPAFEEHHACRDIINRFRSPTRSLPFPSLLVGSNTDPYASAAAAESFANAWGSRFINAGDAGHINVESGHGPWPLGEALLAELLQGGPGTSQNE